MFVNSSGFRRFQFAAGTAFLSVIILSLSGCEGLGSLNSKAITSALQPTSSTTLQSGSPSPSPSVKPSSTPTPTPTTTSTPAPMPTTSAVPVSGVTPAWLQGKALNTWIEIPNTSGSGGAATDPWGALTLRDDTSELFSLANGGHADASDNRVTSIRLTDDAPQWILRCAPTPDNLLVPNTSHYLDGKPASRHVYQHNHWVPGVNRLMLIGLHFGWPAAYQFPTVDGFNPDTNTWDPPGTWPDLPAGAGYGIYRQRNSSYVWTNGLTRFDPATKQYSTPITHFSGDSMRYPMSQDTRRNQLFALQIGDSQGYDVSAGIQASRVPLNGDTQYHVTFNPSAALTQFIADAPQYPAMDYDPANDQFLFYDGRDGYVGRVYVIKPNDGNTWDMSILPLATGSPLPPAVHPAGINGRFMYVPALKGFAMMPIRSSNIWFIRTSN